MRLKEKNHNQGHIQNLEDYFGQKKIYKKKIKRRQKATPGNKRTIFNVIMWHLKTLTAINLIKRIHYFVPFHSLKLVSTLQSHPLYLLPLDLPHWSIPRLHMFTSHPFYLFPTSLPLPPMHEPQTVHHLMIHSQISQTVHDRLVNYQIQ